MLDLETLSTKSNAVIIAIGAVKFDPKEKKIYDRFYSRVDSQSCIDAGMDISGNTILWWLQQSEGARSEFKGILPKLQIVLDAFSMWAHKEPRAIEVWGNGATFDNVILTNAYEALKMKRPWDYKGDRCYRTIKALFPHIPVKDFGTAHRADHDAECQAIHLMQIWPLISQS